MKKIFFSFLITLTAGGGLAMASAADPHALDQMKSNIGFVMGSKTHADYVKYQCGGTDPGVGVQCSGPPEAGLMGAFLQLVNRMPTNIQTANPAIATCEDLPTSSTLSVTDSVYGTVAVTFAAATKTIPANWTGGGQAYDRRLELSFTSTDATAVKGAVEVSCTVASAYTAVNMLVGAHAPNFVRPINLYAGQKGTVSAVQVFFAEADPTNANALRGVSAVDIEIDETAKTYTFWAALGTRSDTGTNYLSVDRIATKGKYETDEASVNFKRFVVQTKTSGTDTYNGTTLAAMTGASVDTIETSTTFALSTVLSTASIGDIIHHQGCINFAAVDTAPASATLCTGLDLTNPEVPAIDSAGSFSPSWAVGTMVSKMEVLTL